MLRFRQFLNEGGAFGHLSNVFDINFTFGEMKNIIDASLKGELENVRLKTDGQNLMFSYIDGEIRMARNAGHIKNFGAASLTADGMATKFAARGGLEVAYNNAIIDLRAAISNLSDKQIQKIFKNGKKFMSIEVMHVDSPNVVLYGSNQLRFHGTREYDKDGNVVGDFKKDGDILAGMIKQRGAQQQKTFVIKPLELVKLPEEPNFDKQKSIFIKMLNKIIKPFRLGDSDKFDEYKKRYWMRLLKAHGINNEQLLKRWAFFDKTYSIANIKKDNYSESQLKWILDFDKTKHQDEAKEMMLPFEFLFLRLGATVLKNIQQFMVANPDKSVKRMNKQIDKVLKLAKGSGDPKVLKKVNLELRRIENAGGMKMISPEEGITFMYKGEFLKFTGLFAPINQLIGLLYQLEPK